MWLASPAATRDIGWLNNKNREVLFLLLDPLRPHRIRSIYPPSKPGRQIQAEDSLEGFMQRSGRYFIVDQEIIVWLMLLFRGADLVQSHALVTPEHRAIGPTSDCICNISYWIIFRHMEKSGAPHQGLLTGPGTFRNRLGRAGIANQPFVRINDFMVARDRIELPTRGFSDPKGVFWPPCFQQLTHAGPAPSCQEWTGADTR